MLRNHTIETSVPGGRVGRRLGPVARVAALSRSLALAEQGEDPGAE